MENEKIIKQRPKLVLPDEDGEPGWDIVLFCVGQDVDVTQFGEEHRWTLDKLIEAGRWAERIKSEANGEPQSNQGFPPIPEGWERFTTLEEWRGGAYQFAWPGAPGWGFMCGGGSPDFCETFSYIQRVKE